MFDLIHVDEKWFWLDEIDRKIYITCNEEEPHRECTSKNFRTKVMFLCGVARPRFDENGVCTFDGKLGLWPFVQQVAAARSSRNRPRGTLETQSINVNKSVYEEFILTKLLPAIKERWPQEGQRLVIQHDNASPHGEFPQDLLSRHLPQFDVEVRCQPPNSPDLNVLDLGYFNAIQSLQYTKSPTTIDELIVAVQDSFHELDSLVLERVFFTLQSVMLETLRNKDSNKYKLPHMGKDRLIKTNSLPISLPCDIDIVQNCNFHYL
ncbi:hypothetical protein AeMF1_011275 [Aphanomyces euteiches]|nr:hypothetical protein AeMF1_011275 [Aphanomyces euteiches]